MTIFWHASSMCLVLYVVRSLFSIFILVSDMQRFVIEHQGYDNFLDFIQKILCTNLYAKLKKLQIN